MPRKQALKEDPISEGKIFAILAYLSILCIIPLLFKKDNQFVLSHGKQGLVLFIGEVGVFVLSIIFPWLLRIGLFCLGIYSFVGIISALQGRTIKLPFISRMAENITL